VSAPNRPLPSAERPTPRPGETVRTVAAALLSAVLDHAKPLDGLLDPATGYRPYRDLPARDRSLARAILGVALRRHGEISAILGRLIEKKPPRRSGLLGRILEIAAAQILFMEVADHAAVATALDAISADESARHFKGLANAVLRRLTREREAILAGLDCARLDTPDWLWSRWTANYGEAAARRIAEAHLIEPSLDLAVKSDPAGWAERLGGIVLPTGTVRLVASGPIEDLQGFAEGQWWVQDAAAALGPRLLGEVAGKRVADLCAAPGGKTAALCHAGARVTSVDISAHRIERLATNLERLRLSAETVAADILTWDPAELFDAVLLDAPCTATGTIRRHPDIAWLKRPEDVATLAELQGRMIDRAAALLKPGGTLVYCTCSLEREEGEDQLARALHRHPLELLPVGAAEVAGLAEIITPVGAVRTLPCQLPMATPRLSGLDGFFVARLRKR
jgi:16S rRNA (cytosine967-C5)-methyltransferase